MSVSAIYDMQGFKEFMQLAEISINPPAADLFSDGGILDNHTIIVFDTETTGLDTRIPHVQILSISAAAYSLKEKNISKVFDKFIDLTPQTQSRMEDDKKFAEPNPEKRYSQIDDFLKVSKWHEREKHGNEEKVVNDFVDFVHSFPNPLLAGYNAGFDMRMINSTLKKYGNPPLRVPVIDVMKFVHLFVDPAMEHLARNGHLPAQEMLGGLKNKYGKKSFTLQNVANILGVLEADGHVSVNDIVMTGRVLGSALDFIKQHREKFGQDYHQDLGRSYRDYRNKLKYFASVRNEGHLSHKHKKRAIELLNHDVFSGVQSYADYLANKIKLENQKTKPNKTLISNLTQIIFKLRELLQNYSGDKTEIIKLIYNS